MIKRGMEEVKLNVIDDETKEVLQAFNKMRNWQNHVPESLLVSELELIDNGKAELPMDPVTIIHYNYVTFEYFLDLYERNVAFYNKARKLIQTAKKDYALIIGTSVSYPRVYCDKAVKFEKSEPTIMSAKIQGL